MKAIIFDFDGTLIDSEYVAYLRKLEFFCTYGFTKEQIAKTAGMNVHQTVELLAPLLDENKKTELIKCWNKSRPSINIKLLLFEEVIALFQEVKQRGLLIGIVSNRSVNRLKEVIVQSGLEDYVDLMVGLDHLLKPKPDPELYQVALAKLEMQPDEVLIVEDSYIGIQAGKRCGCCVLCRKETRYIIDQNNADHYFYHHLEVLDILDQYHLEKRTLHGITNNDMGHHP